MKKLYLVLALAIMGNLGMKAQDFQLSLYDAGPLFLNPALTGLVEAPWRAHLQYRSQWKGLTNKPYTTVLGSYDRSAGKWGYGAQVANMVAGASNYKAFQFLASGSYNIAFDKPQNHHLSMALQLGFTQKAIDNTGLNFNNQFEAKDGGQFNTGISSGESIASASKMFEQVNAGFLYYYAKETSRLNPFVGYSLFNLTEPDEGLYSSVKLPRRSYLHAGLRINFTTKFYVLPKVLIMNQGKMQQITGSLDFGYYLEHQHSFILGGFTVRPNDAVVLSAGVKKGTIALRLGYDVNIMPISANARKGAFELGFTIIGAQPKPKAVKSCPRI